jgi:predicted small lipoprotein YifL
VTDFSNQKWARLAAVGALVAALGLSACGRKGPLDPPPSAAAPVQYSGEPGPAQRAAPSQIGVGADGKAAAPPPSGSQQRFILDWLVE